MDFIVPEEEALTEVEVTKENGSKFLKNVLTMHKSTNFIPV